jgi:hypothetical protein
VGLSAIESRCRKAIQEGSNTKALEIANGDLDKVTGWTVLEASQLGDKTCLAIVGELEKYLGIGISTLVNLYNPALVILDHRLAVAGQGFLDQIARGVKRQALGNSTANLEFRYGALGSDAGLLGAGLNVLERMFEIPALKPPKFMTDRSVLSDMAANRRSWAENQNLELLVPDLPYQTSLHPPLGEKSQDR